MSPQKGDRQQRVITSTIAVPLYRDDLSDQTDSKGMPTEGEEFIISIVKSFFIKLTLSLLPKR